MDGGTDSSGIITINGNVDTPGLDYFSVKWPYIMILAACVASVHATLVGLILWVSNPIVVAEDSNVVVARLLEGVIKTLHGTGSLCDGREIAEAVKRDGIGNMVRWVMGFERILEKAMD